MSDRELLKDAGYREKMYVASRLAQDGAFEVLERALEHWTYDPRRDMVFPDQGQQEGPFKFGTRFRVRWEASESRRILSELGHEDPFEE